MESLKVLREQRDALAKEIKTLVEVENKQWTAANDEKYNQKVDALTAIDGQIKRVIEVQDMMREEAANDAIYEATNRIAHDKKVEPSIFNKWIRGGDNALTAQDWTTIRNTMSTTTGSEGGFTVQTDVAKTVADALKAYGGMRDVADVIQTVGGNDMSFPTSDGTAETGELIAQNVTATAADPVFGAVTLTTYKFGSKIVAVPFELLQDSSVDIEQFVIQRCATRIGRATNTYFTTGTGTAQPRGVVTAAASGKVGTTGQTVTVIYDDIVDLVHSVDPAYRALGRCRFMMNDASLKVIRKLKDSQNRPIFIPGYDLANSMPDTILGYPVQINQDVAVMAANAKSILFGDFKFYTIRDVMNTTMYRFTDSAYTKLGQVGFLMWARSGGNFIDVGGAVKYYQNSAT